MEITQLLDMHIDKIPDFPKAGILYYDITGILKNIEVFQALQNELYNHYANHHFSAIAAIESRGFIFAAPLALSLKCPLILLRKAGKLPDVTVGKNYILEYASAKIEVHLKDVPQGGNVLLVDDLLASGGTMRAAADLLNIAGVEVKNVCAIVGLSAVGYTKILADLDCKTLINYPL